MYVMNETVAGLSGIYSDMFKSSNSINSED